MNTSDSSPEPSSDFLFFPELEYATRLRNVRSAMALQGIDAALITAPENIYYLAGLEHWGYFAQHVLIVAQDGEMMLVARAMERVTIAKQVGTRAHFVGFADADAPARIVGRLLQELGLSKARLGLEMHSLYQSAKFVDGLREARPQAQFVDIGPLVDALRRVKSPLEQRYTRDAAAVSDAMMQAAIAATRAGATERSISAETHRAMILAGGEPPAYGPFIRPASRLGEEHTTWADSTLRQGDSLFLELSGCVRRYHAPMGRLVFVGEAPEGTRRIEQACLAALDAVVTTIRPGVSADGVYQSWQARVNDAGLAHYQRHHCGYMVGSAYPPAWSGPGVPLGLRKGSDLELKSGMVFHLLSWLMGTGQGDYFVSESVLVLDDGCEVLTAATPRSLTIV